MATIYVDPSVQYGTGRWCHMWTDGEDAELDAFAKRIGLVGVWSQVSHGVFTGRFYHYDLKPSKREIAVAHGAIEIQLRDFIKTRPAYQAWKDKQTIPPKY